MQVPRSGESGTTAVRRVASPANPDIPLDGLGGDYDYAVQLAAFTNYGLSSDFLSSYPSLDLMRVKTQSKGKTFYIVIAGTFENKQLAVRTKSNAYQHVRHGRTLHSNRPIDPKRSDQLVSRLEL